jgi:hypothetical protein
MREKIKDQLKAKLQTLGVKNLSNTRIDAIADKLATKITEETEIDAKLDELNDIMPFADIAKQDDRLRTLESKKDKPATQQQQQQDPPPADEMPSWAKPLFEKVTALEAEKQKEAIRNKVHKHEKLKNIPQILLKGRTLPEKEEDIDAFVAEVESDFAAFNQEVVEKGLATGSKPASSTTKNEAATIDAEIAAWAGKDKK